MPLSAGRCSTSRDRGKKGEEGLEDKGGWPRSSLEEHRWTTCVDKYNRRWPGPCLRLFLPFPFFFLPRRHFANPLGIPLNFSEGGEGRHSFPPPPPRHLEKISNFKLLFFLLVIRYRRLRSSPSYRRLLSANYGATTCIHLSITFRRDGICCARRKRSLEYRRDADR